MKKVLSIICFLLCALTASAVSYASPYKGGSNYSSYSVERVHTSAPIMGMAQAPVASMRSTSGSISRSIAENRISSVSTSTVKGIYTSATQVSGGVTTAETYSQISSTGKRKIASYPVPEGACTHCDWVWVDDLYGPGLGGYVCAVCDADILGGCDCNPCHCDVPVGDGRDVWMFMAAIAAAYTIYKNAKKEEKANTI